jgi:hypothetical protein
VFHISICFWCNSFICSNHCAHHHLHFTDTVKPLQNVRWFKWNHAFIEKIMHRKRTVIISVKLSK